MAAGAPVTPVRHLLRSLDCDGAAGVALLATCLVLLAVALAGDPVRELLRYDRAGLAAGEWWRLAGAHVVHLGMTHAALNVLGLVLMWALFARAYGAGAWLAITGASAIAIDAGLWWLDPQVAWYVGLSGVLHGVMAAGTLAHWRQREPDRWVLAAFLVAKLAWEQGVGPLPFEGSGAVIVQAHLYGAIGGLAAAFVAGAFVLPSQSQPP